MSRKTRLVILLIAAVFPFVLHTNASAQRDAFSGTTITGTVYFVGGPRPGRSLPFRLVVDRITTSDEVNQLNSALQSSGQDGLLKTLSRMKAGRIEIGSGVGIPANAILATDEGEGRTKLTILINEIYGSPNCVMERVRRPIHSVTPRRMLAGVRTREC